MNSWILESFSCSDCLFSTVSMLSTDSVVCTVGSIYISWVSLGASKSNSASLRGAIGSGSLGYASKSNTAGESLLPSRSIVYASGW